MDARTWIVDGVRTPMGTMNGVLSSIPAPRLGSACIEALLRRTGVEGSRVDEVIMGNVIGAGLGQNPARQAALFAGLPASVGATTVSKVCGSGLKAVMLADQAIRLGEAGLIVAGGIESMSRAPYLLTRAREGYRLGHGELIDAMIHDGLWDVYNQKHMGTCGDACAASFHISRKEQDDFAVRSFARARKAIADGLFRDEIVPVEVGSRGKTTVVADDEGPSRFDEAKLRALKPAFGAGPDVESTITAGNASSISDGAAAVLLASDAERERLKLEPMARVVGAATHSQDPEWFTTAPVYAIRKLLDRVGWGVDQVDLFEINEAFAVVAEKFIRDLDLDRNKVNVNGGSIALGHPIGATGSILIGTVLDELERRDLKRGLVTMCAAGGMAPAIIIERV
jgi:acetyl-CoA C-acetyltransferase